MLNSLTTLRQRRGAWAERIAGQHLTALGWQVLASNVRVGRDEIDLLAVESGGQSSRATLVVVEVRGLHSRGFGAPEESVDRAKVARLYRAALALQAAGRLPHGEPLPRAPWRVDLIVVDARHDPPLLRHLRALEMS
jgi:putative endonuclease